MRSTVSIGGALGAFAGLVAWAGAVVPLQTSQPVRSGPNLMISFSGEQNGYLTPCGCSSPMLGGVPRRATWLGSLRSSNALVNLDNGDLTEALGRQDELKSETLVEMLNELDYSAINLGEKDFRLGLPYLRSLQARFKGVFLCANGRSESGGFLFNESTVVTRIVAGKPVRIAAVGLLSDRYEQQLTALNPGMKLEKPEETLSRIVASITAAAEVRILLFHGPKNEAEELAKRFPAFQLVVCSHEGDHPMNPVHLGGSVVVCGGQDGKYGSRAQLQAGISWQVGNVTSVPLGPEYADDSRITPIKQAYLDRIAAENLLAKVPKVPLSEGDRFTGSSACAGCHVGAYRIWQASGHSHSLTTLEKVKQNLDPECVQCHVTGLDRATGFVDSIRTPMLGHVGCESCHGPGAKHVANPASSKLKSNGSASCTGCHNPQNSPNFAFAAYWSKVRH